MNEIQNIIIHILDIIGYADDKEAFAKDFLTICEQQAMMAAIDSLPKDKQDAFEQKMTWAKDDERRKAVLLEYIHPAAMEQIFSATTQSSLRDYLQTIEPTLSDDIKQQLGDYFLSLQTQYQTPDTVLQQLAR